MYYGGSFNSVKESLFGIAKVTVGDVILLAFRFLTFRALIVNGILEISRKRSYLRGLLMLRYLVKIVTLH